MSNLLRLLLLLLLKEWPRANRSCCSLKKSNMSDSHVIKLVSKTSYLRKKMFSTVFPPCYAEEWITSIALFLRARGVIFGCCLLHKSTCEWIAPITHYKRATMSDFLLSLFKKEQLRDSLKKRANCNCALSLKKKRAIRSKNRWANINPAFPVQNDEHDNMYLKDMHSPYIRAMF